MVKKVISKTITNENGEEVVVQEEVEVVEDTDNEETKEETNTESPADKIKKALDEKDKENKETKTDIEDTDVDINTLRAELEKAKKEKADLLKEVMSKKEKLKEYDGIDATEAKKLLDEKKAAEEAIKQAEREKLEKENNWEALKKQMVEENNKTIADLKKQISGLQTELESNKKEREALFVDNKFEESKYIRENLILSPTKTKVLFGSYFEVENNELVAYNAPKGSNNRVRLVDANGDNLNFDKAIEKIVSQDPDKNTLLKSKTHIGAGSSGNNAGNTSAIKTKMSSMDKILQGLSSEK